MALAGRRDRMRHKYVADQPMMSGETVTAAKFVCRKCDHVHEVSEGVKNLPVCPHCQHDEWELK